MTTLIVPKHLKEKVEKLRTLKLKRGASIQSKPCNKYLIMEESTKEEKHSDMIYYTKPISVNSKHMEHPNYIPMEIKPSSPP